LCPWGDVSHTISHNVRRHFHKCGRTWVVYAIVHSFACFFAWFGIRVTLSFRSDLQVSFPHTKNFGAWFPPRVLLPSCLTAIDLHIASLVGRSALCVVVLLSDRDGPSTSATCFSATDLSYHFLALSSHFPYHFPSFTGSVYGDCVLLPHCDLCPGLRCASCPQQFGCLRHLRQGCGARVCSRPCSACTVNMAGPSTLGNHECFTSSSRGCLAQPLWFLWFTPFCPAGVFSTNSNLKRCSAVPSFLPHTRFDLLPHCY
jgi:hypothetical protein